MKLNGNNQVEHEYACGVENGTPYCIEGTYSDNPDKEAIIQANLNVLTPLFTTLYRYKFDSRISSVNFLMQTHLLFY